MCIGNAFRTILSWTCTWDSRQISRGGLTKPRQLREAPASSDVPYHFTNELNTRMTTVIPGAIHYHNSHRSTQQEATQHPALDDSPRAVPAPCLWSRVVCSVHIVPRCGPIPSPFGGLLLGHNILIERDRGPTTWQHSLGECPR